MHAEELSSGPSYVNAPDFKGATGWLNTDHPISLKDLRGKVVVLDFWTFCCINCMQILPDLHKLEEKYKNELVVIGVHSAKFANEKDTSNIREAIMRYGITHPVANDSNFAIWNAYNVQAWPTLVLISPDGKVMGSASGEGHFDQLDRAIAQTIEKFSKEGKLNTKPLHFTLESAKQVASPLSFPGKILADPDNKFLFISDSSHNRVIVTDLDGKVKSVLGSGKRGLQDGAFASAMFNHPQGMCLDNGFLYIADTENHAIRRVDFNKKTVTTIAGNGKQGPTYSKYRGAGISTQLNSPWDLVRVADRIYIAMAGAHQLWWLDPKTNEVASYAGTGHEGIKDGPLEQAWLAQPSGITTDGKELYFADSEVSAVRMAGLGNDAQVKTIVGHGLFDFGDRDGGAGTALLQHPLGVAFSGGVLYVADSYNHKIKIIDPARRTVTTLLGTGKPGNVDGGDPQFSEPGGLTVLNGKLYIADTNNNEVRVIDLTTKQAKTLKLTGLH